jgi:hypothetical protein
MVIVINWKIDSILKNDYFTPMPGKEPGGSYVGIH